MNFEEEGLRICNIYKGGTSAMPPPKRRRGRNKGVYVTADVNSVDCAFSALNARDGDVLQVCPRGKERDVVYISGSSGSGKSYFAANFIKEYLAVHPKNPVYLFSSISEDPCLDGVKAVKRVALNDEFLETEFELADFEDSLLVFDDIDVIVNKALKGKLYNILNNLLMTGRHSKTSVIFTSHIATNGRDTKVILAECTHLVCFPKMMNGRTRDYLLKAYIGLSNKEIQNVMQLRSRAVVFVRGYPQVVVHEKGCFIINGEYL